MSQTPGLRYPRPQHFAGEIAIQSLLQRMESWFDQYANPRLDGKTKPVTGRGQLDLAHLEQQGDIPFAQAWPSKWLADRKKFRNV